MPIHLVVLNYNGRQLLADCLPSILRAARSSRHSCEVVVIDNGSVDDSVAWLQSACPEVRLIERPNRGLCSYNDVLAELPGRVSVLLNNDIKLADDAIDALVAPLFAAEPGRTRCFMTAPRCWLFDGETHEGLQAAVRWHWGLVEATAYFPGYESSRACPGLTAAAGPVMAVDRELFLELGGFDPLFLPGRLEDFDFAYRGYMAGYEARYVPDAVAFHQGQASFNAAFGPSRSESLALRNTLLFQWKNLRHPLHWLRHLSALPVRLAADCIRAAYVPRHSRWMFLRALVDALRLAPACSNNDLAPRRSWQAERAFFRVFDAARFAERGIPQITGPATTGTSGARTAVVASLELASAGGTR